VSPQAPCLVVGIDTGGTFTDVVAVDRARRRLYALKVPSRPERPGAAFLDGLQRIVASAGYDPGAVERIVHGTTIGTNAVLEHKGATLGLLTTRGFEDILAIGRTKRSEMYDLMMDPEEPLFLAPRRRIVGIPERVDASGTVLEPLDEGAVVREVRRLRDEYRVESIAVCYLFSFLHPEHEHRTEALIREHFPGLPVSISSSVDPKFREYERLVVTAFDAYLRPAVASYLSDLEAQLGGHGFRCPFQIMQSHGGISAARNAVERPVGTMLSGPAAGVVAGAAAGQAAGFDELVTLDMGGTSFDVALVREGRIETSAEGRLGKYPLRVPMVDVHTIGAGGGSIAFLDPAGGLKVGPVSAGAVPGPACYGKGGTEPTVTDASLVLGYLNPETYAGGGFPLYADRSHEAIARRIAGPLGLDVPRAAAGIHDIVNTQMAEAVRLVSVRRGYDLRGIALVAMGGAGPVHAGRLADLLDAKAVVVPPRPGVASAYGLLMADIRHELFRPYLRPFHRAPSAELAALFAEIDAGCAERMRVEGVAAAEVSVLRYAEMRYVGQSYELAVPLPDGSVDDRAVVELQRRFHELHDRYYGHHSDESEVEFVGMRGVHVYPLPVPPAGADTPAGGRRAAPLGTRRVYFAERGYAEAPVYDRFALPVEASIAGPAILDQADTTTVVYPGQTATVHPSGSVILARRGAGTRQDPR
jgi:N-methylhydantoinase A/oxoprolinase/acetone carboxylase beta subunit